MDRDIAVVGMSCLFPGAENVDQFWANNVRGVDAIGEIPKGRWPNVDFKRLPAGHDTRIVCTRGGFLPSGSTIDARRYGLMPNLIRNADPDVVFYVGTAAEGAMILRQAKELGITPGIKFVGSEEMSEKEILELAGEEAVDGTYSVALWGSVPADFEQRVKDKFNAPMHYGITYGYDALMSVAKAIEAAQSLESSKIRDGIAGLDFTGVSGRIKFESFVGPDGRQYSNQCRIAPYLVRWVDGKRTVVR